MSITVNGSQAAAEGAGRTLLVNSCASRPALTPPNRMRHQFMRACTVCGNGSR